MPLFLWWLFGLLMGAEVRAGAGVALSQAVFEVQEKASFNWRYSVGEDGLGTGDVIRLHDPVFHGIRWSKWGELTPWWDQCTPQSAGQEASFGLVSVSVRREGVRLDDSEILLYLSRSNCDAERKICRVAIHEPVFTEIEVVRGNVLPGDELVLGLGDQGACLAECAGTDCSVCTDCGFELPDRAFAGVHWPAELCRVGADCVELAVPLIDVLAREDPDTTLATVPSQAVVGVPFRLKVALLDIYGNPVTDATHTVVVHAPGGELRAELTEDDGGWVDFSVVIDTPGVHRITVDAGPMRVQTNPIEILTVAPQRQVLWGDIHVHHGYTYLDLDGRVRDANHDYGRDVVGLDVVSETQKALGVEIGEEALWSALQAGCRSYTEPGKYIVMLGFEWMGSAAGEEFGRESFGHHNVYYDDCDGPLGTHDTERIASLWGEKGLWSWLETATENHGVRAMSVPHSMRRTGHDFERASPVFQTVAEIYSEAGDNTAWGLSDDDAPGSVQDLLNSGLRLGWIGGSDNHDGWMGNPYSRSYVESGLGAFVVDEHSRKGVFDAMLARHTYATTGHRPIVRFSVSDGDFLGVQGTELLAKQPRLSWRYYGTEDVQTMELWRLAIVEGGLAEQVLLTVGDGLDLSGEAVPAWDGVQDTAFWIEVRQWDGKVAWSSPIWLTADCARTALGAVDPLGRCADGLRDTGEQPSEAAKADDVGAPKTRCGCGVGGAGSGGMAWLGLLFACFIRRSEPDPRRAAQA